MMELTAFEEATILRKKWSALAEMGLGFSAEELCNDLLRLCVLVQNEEMARALDGEDS